ncbi:hypothetical protein BpHYR1_007800 [Brachionus plicatilis]|uniref:Uncharacterized protein n=1 Tax=Brachionus plicatilis TaxID=10195 RepID=A0A3M7PR52_BRAPC|nr:hypothetical protein BpHYR1_007800 [Brachionus plicatilis]
MLNNAKNMLNIRNGSAKTVQFCRKMHVIKKIIISQTDALFQIIFSGLMCWGAKYPYNFIDNTANMFGNPPKESIQIRYFFQKGKYSVNFLMYAKAIKNKIKTKLVKTNKTDKF